MCGLCFCSQNLTICFDTTDTKEGSRVDERKKIRDANGFLLGCMRFSNHLGNIKCKQLPYVSLRIDKQCTVVSSG